MGWPEALFVSSRPMVIFSGWIFGTYFKFYFYLYSEGKKVRGSGRKKGGFITLAQTSGARPLPPPERLHVSLRWRTDMSSMSIPGVGRLALGRKAPSRQVESSSTLQHSTIAPSASRRDRCGTGPGRRNHQTFPRGPLTAPKAGGGGEGGTLTLCRRRFQRDKGYLRKKVPRPLLGRFMGKLCTTAGKRGRQWGLHGQSRSQNMILGNLLQAFNGRAIVLSKQGRGRSRSDARYINKTSAAKIWVCYRKKQKASIGLRSKLPHQKTSPSNGSEKKDMGADFGNEVWRPADQRPPRPYLTLFAGSIYSRRNRQRASAEPDICGWATFG